MLQPVGACKQTVNVSKTYMNSEICTLTLTFSYFLMGVTRYSFELGINMALAILHGIITKGDWLTFVCQDTNVEERYFHCKGITQGL